MKITGNVKGIAEMKKKLLSLAKAHPEKVARALYTEMSIEATEMKKRTPVDTRPNAPHPGNLRDSIHVLEPEISGTKVSCMVATGAQADEYDLEVHENPDAHHPIGQWKYMESVLNESRQHMNKRVATRVHFDKGDE